jgi:predicted  nucleic acid-binding Zn-ribbon protein
MKKTLINICIAIAILVSVWYIFFPTPVKFDTKPYETKIDSLQHEIDSIKTQNDSLENFILEVEGSNAFLQDKNYKLYDKIDKLNSDLQNAKKPVKYTATQVDSFFHSRYIVEYEAPSEDTTFLPIEVGRSVVSDLKQLDINRQIVDNQDTAITNLKDIVDNKDTIIFTLREKEANYQSISKKQSDQADNYKIQIGGLKEDINRSNKKLLFGKIQKIILGAVIGFFILNK